MRRAHGVSSPYDLLRMWLVMTTRVWLRWLPAGVVPVVIVAAAVAAPWQADAAVDLPDKTPEQVLAMVGQDTVHALSGTIEQTSKLGLPQLDTVGGGAPGGMASALELLTGSHTARVYLDGPDNARVQVLDRLAERDLVRHGDDVWLYNSDDNTATHVAIPADAHAEAGDATVPGDVPTPAQLAHRLLAAIDPSTTVTVGRDTVVAGRTTYELVLNPRASDTLIGSVSIAVDSETGLPLSVDVQARGQTVPAFRLAFTALTLGSPDADLFAFVPPPGATVQEHVIPQHHAKPEGAGVPGSPAHEPDLPFTVTGTGWDAIVELPANAVPAELEGSPLFAQATRAVSGGRLLSTALANVFVTDDGRVLVGSVPLERLQAAAGGQ